MQNTAEHICLIVNPMAGAGAAGRNLEALKRALDKHFQRWDVKVTEGPGHASALAEEAASEGQPFDIVAAVGGDGTCHEVINGLMSGARAPRGELAFTVIPFGTGSDLQKSLEVPRKLSGALQTAASGADRLSDVGLATVTRNDAPTKRYFINVGGFGANGEVVRQVNAGSKKLGGKVAFARAALAAAASYTPAMVRLRWTLEEEEEVWEGRLLSCFVANGAYCGGGMWVGRGGTMQDGRLDLSVIPSTGVLRQLIDLRRLYDGHIDRAKGAFQRQMVSLDVTARQREAVYIDLDGELSGMLPARFEILPKTLRIRGGWVGGTSEMIDQIDNSAN